MNEMLGNQYFLARRFKDATIQFERALLFDLNNFEVKKKLIVCYIQQKELKLALKQFTDLISKNIEIVLKSDPSKDCCPCLQMISEIENSPNNLTDSEKKTMLGMLWLYCDILESRKYFNSLLEIEPSNTEFQTITNIVNQSIPTN